MIRVTFTVLTARPRTTNTLTITAPEFLLALKALAEALGCLIHWDGNVRFSPNPNVPAELFCRFEDGVVSHEARISYVAVDATVEGLAHQLQAHGYVTKPEPTTPAPMPVTPPVPFTDPSRTNGGPQPVPVTQTVEVLPTPDPVVITDPEGGRPRVAAVWGDSGN